MSSLGDSFGWPFRSGSWVGTVLLQGLILIIPIIGQIAAAGWLLLCMDNIRAGRYELPPAGFHLGRGIGLFGVYLVYGLAVGIPSGLLIGLGGALEAQGTGAGGALFALGYLFEIAASLLLLFLMPAIVSATWRGGFAGGLNVGAVWRTAVANPTNSILAALIVLVAGIISEIGLIACFIGVLFTAIYGYAVIAGAISWFDQQTYGGQAAVQQPGTIY